MDNTGIFILSLDCEGKWGMADCITPIYEKSLTTENIRNVSDSLLKILNQNKIPASFAFVSSLLLNSETFQKNKDIFFEAPDPYKPWLSRFIQDIKNNYYEGWFYPDCIKKIQDYGMHEISSQSCFHRPLNERELSIEEAEYDFICSKRVMEQCGVYDLKTFIYPRRVIGYTELLRKYGYIGYRGGTTDKANIMKRIGHLISEFNIMEKSHKALGKDKESIEIIPRGFFLNWPYSFRKYVPPSITYLRWKHIIDHAIVNKQIAHMWFHPHNLITAPNMINSFEDIIKYVVEQRDAGKLTIMTMKDYCLSR